ncbi:MAG: hypothetical protein IPO41_03730 [Acidobacteria bacterium]|nr:hypothetical protein [Acidobacteriota bacterium]
MIAMVTWEQGLSGGVGLVVIIFNKQIATMLLWWEEKIIKLADPINPWVYRITAIVVGTLFLSIAVLK